MKLSRTDLVPVLAIVAGGVLGASLSFSLLGSRSDEVVFVVAPISVPENVEAPRLEVQTYRYVVRMQDIEAQRLLERDRVERVEAEVESLKSRYEEARARLERDQGERLRRDIEEGLRELEFRIREELQEQG